MKVFVIVFAALCCTLSLAQTTNGKNEEEQCYANIEAICQPSKEPVPFTNCTARYGALELIEGQKPPLERYLQQLANNFLHRSFDFLLLATHYGNYIKNRPGFEKLYRGLSDELWSDGINTIKYLTSRGGGMDFNAISHDHVLPASDLSIYELQSLGKALDIEKKLAQHVFYVQKQASGHAGGHHDPEIVHHLEEKFMGKQSETIRTLAGHAKDLSNILATSDASLGLYLFDNYLKE